MVKKKNLDKLGFIEDLFPSEDKEEEIYELEQKLEKAQREGRFDEVEKYTKELDEAKKTILKELNERYKEIIERLEKIYKKRVNTIVAMSKCVSVIIIFFQIGFMIKILLEGEILIIELLPMLIIIPVGLLSEFNIRPRDKFFRYHIIEEGEVLYKYKKALEELKKIFFPKENISVRFLRQYQENYPNNLVTFEYYPNNLVTFEYLGYIRLV